MSGVEVVWRSVWSAVQNKFGRCLPRAGLVSDSESWVIDGYRERSLPDGEIDRRRLTGRF